MDDDIFSFIDSPIIAPAQLIEETDKNWRVGEPWLRIKGITRAECWNGTGAMERIEPITSNSTGDVKERYAKTGKDAPIGFGKYRDLSVIEIKKNDPNYFQWMFCNVDKFTKLCNELSIKP